jgi:hypothetical protein|tara:strand:+ start:492 stop:635 length:144 start_codon:yes stop_codon:yes gene_type:complete
MYLKATLADVVLAAFGPVVMSNGYWNFLGYSNTQVDELSEQAITITK